MLLEVRSSANTASISFRVASKYKYLIQHTETIGVKLDWKDRRV